jgi:hypothetical protein
VTEPFQHKLMVVSGRDDDSCEGDLTVGWAKKMPPRSPPGGRAECPHLLLKLSILADDQ